MAIAKSSKPHRSARQPETNRLHLHSAPIMPMSSPPPSIMRLVMYDIRAILAVPSLKTNGPFVLAHAGGDAS